MNIFRQWVQFFADVAVRQKSARNFFEKLALTFPPDPNRATYRSKEGGYDLGGFCPREA